MKYTGMLFTSMYTKLFLHHDIIHAVFATKSPLKEYPKCKRRWWERFVNWPMKITHNCAWWPASGPMGLFWMFFWGDEILLPRDYVISHLVRIPFLKKTWFHGMAWLTLNFVRSSNRKSSWARRVVGVSSKLLKELLPAVTKSRKMEEDPTKVPEIPGDHHAEFREQFVARHPDVLLPPHREPHRKLVERIQRDYMVHGAIPFYQDGIRVLNVAQQIFG